MKIDLIYWKKWKNNNKCQFKQRPPMDYMSRNIRGAFFNFYHVLDLLLIMNMIEKFVKMWYHDHVQFDHDHFYDQTNTFMITLKNGRRQLHIYKCFDTTSKSNNNAVYSRGRMVELRHSLIHTNILAKNQEFKDTNPKICGSCCTKLFSDRFPTSL